MYPSEPVYLTYTYLRVLILTHALRALSACVRMHAAAQPDVLEYTINREHVLVAVWYSCTGVPDWYGSTGTCVYCIPVHSHSLRYLPADRAVAGRWLNRVEIREQQSAGVATGMTIHPV